MMYRTGLFNNFFIFNLLYYVSRKNYRKYHFTSIYYSYHSASRIIHYILVQKQFICILKHQNLISFEVHRTTILVHIKNMQTTCSQKKQVNNNHHKMQYSISDLSFIQQTHLSICHIFLSIT